VGKPREESGASEHPSKCTRYRKEGGNMKKMVFEPQPGGTGVGGEEFAKDKKNRREKKGQTHLPNSLTTLDPRVQLGG